MTKIGDILMDGYTVGEIRLRVREDDIAPITIPDFGNEEPPYDPNEDVPEGREGGAPTFRPGISPTPPPPGVRRPPGPTFRRGVGPGSEERAQRRDRDERYGPTFRPGIGPGPRQLRQQREVHARSGTGHGMNATTREQLSGQTAEAAGVTPEFPVAGGVDWKHMDAEYIRRANKAWSMASAEERAGSALVSGFRSFEKQRQIWESGVRPAARPGHSMHELGGAGDWRHYGWLLKYGPQVGLRQLPGDPVHFQLSQPSGDMAGRRERSSRYDPADATIQPAGAEPSGYLERERAWAARELDSDPELRRYLRGVITHEQSPGERSKVFEAMLNRVNALRETDPGLTLRQYLARQGSAQFYGPIRRGEIN